MRTKTIFIALAALAALTVRGEASQLSAASRRARYKGDCPKDVSPQNSESFPIPVKTGKGLRYRQIYYPVIEGLIYSPSSLAEFDPEGREGTCTVPIRVPDTVFGSPLGKNLSRKAKALSYEQYQAKSSKLYEATELVAKAYMSGIPDPQAAKEFKELFAVMAEPGLKEFYRALSPEFWAWLEKK